jgi:hypothetical protein
MKFILLNTNCSIYDIKIIKESDKNKVFNSTEEIDQWLFYNRLDSDAFLIIPIEDNLNDLKSILIEYNLKN